MNHTLSRLDLATLEIGSEQPHKAPLFTGAACMMVIEGTVFALLVASYFYYRMHYTEWPPADAGPPDWMLPTVNLALFVLSCLPMSKVDAAAREQDRPRLFRLLAVSCALMVVIIVLRFFEFGALHTGYSEHSYGSITWAILAAHSVHTVSSTVETLLMLFSVNSVPLDRKHRLDLHISVIYWWFVVGSWILLFAVLQGGARVL